MVVTEPVRRDTGPARSRRRIGAVLAVLVIVAVAVTVIGIIEGTAPATGSTHAPDAVGLIATEQDDPAASDEPRPIHVYRYVPGATFLTMTTVRNDGPVALILLGPAAPPADIQSTSLTWADRLLLSQWPDVVGPDDATPLEAAVVDPGAEVAVWVVWRIGSLCLAGEPPPLTSGSGYGFDTLGLRWSVLGVERSGAIKLGYFVEVRNPSDDPLVLCPA